MTENELTNKHSCIDSIYQRSNNLDELMLNFSSLGKVPKIPLNLKFVRDPMLVSILRKQFLEQFFAVE